MRFWKACLGTFFLVAALMSLAAIHSLAEERPLLDLNDTISDDEVNRRLGEKAKRTSGGESFYFGFDLRSGPLEDARQYLPFLKFLERSTGYSFKLRFTPKHSSIVVDLGTGKVHFAATGAVTFLQAQERYGTLSLARGINSLGKAEYQSVVVVLPESDIQNIGDLKGRRFAFGAVSSTQGHLIPRIVLTERGVDLNDFAAYEYTGSHHNCANAVITGAFDACGMQDTMAELMASDGLIRILHRSRFYPSSGIAANKDVPAAVLEKVKRALLDFDPLGRDKEGLYNWQKTEMPKGFQVTMPADYVELKDWLVRLGFLQGVGASDSGKTR